MLFKRVVLLAAAALPLFAQPDRLFAPIDASTTVVLKGGVSFRVADAQDLGPLPGSEKMLMRLLIKMAPSQEADQRQYYKELDDPASPNYRKRLTPEQIADRFGLSVNDSARITAWLKSMGFNIEYGLDGLNRTLIVFSGTVGQVQAAFRTEIHRYQAFNQTHFANATSPSIPSVLEPLIQAIIGLYDFSDNGVH